MPENSIAKWLTAVAAIIGVLSFLYGIQKAELEQAIIAAKNLLLNEGWLEKDNIWNPDIISRLEEVEAQLRVANVLLENQKTDMGSLYYRFDKMDILLMKQNHSLTNIGLEIGKISGYIEAKDIHCAELN